MFLTILSYAISVPEMTLSLLDLVFILRLVFKQPLSEPFTSIKPLCPSIYCPFKFVKSVP